nr:unnamed protein product [Digitaria exilis]
MARQTPLLTEPRLLLQDIIALLIHLHRSIIHLLFSPRSCTTTMATRPTPRPDSNC